MLGMDVWKDAGWRAVDVCSTRRPSTPRVGSRVPLTCAAIATVTVSGAGALVALVVGFVAVTGDRVVARARVGRGHQRAGDRRAGPGGTAARYTERG